MKRLKDPHMLPEARQWVNFTKLCGQANIGQQMVFGKNCRSQTEQSKNSTLICNQKLCAICQISVLFAKSHLLQKASHKLVTNVDEIDFWSSYGCNHGSKKECILFQNF